VAMDNLGACYHAGRGGVAKDLNKAIEWCTKSAAQGYTLAQTELDQLNAQ